MNIFIATETKVYRVDNCLYTSNSFRKVLERYHNAFGSITLCTRINNCDIENLPKSYEDATSFIENTVEITSLKSVALNKHDADIKAAINECQLVVARVPSIVANKAAKFAKRSNIPYMVEVVGCIWDSYWNYSFSSKFLAAPSYIAMRGVVKNARYATYVTESFLQMRYPCYCDSIHCSNVIIDCSEIDVIERRLRKIHNNTGKKIVLFTAAAIATPYKGQEYVIRAIKQLKEKGYEIEYRLAGNGDSSRLEKIAIECGVRENISFLGGLAREGVISELDNADIYIQPSLQEGLPRSVIEAMSRGCPALGAHTAGIPELLDAECIFKRADVNDIVRVVEDLCKSDLVKYAQRNYSKALEYDNQVLEKRRNDYYAKIIAEIG